MASHPNNHACYIALISKRECFLSERRAFGNSGSLLNIHHTLVPFDEAAFQTLR